MGYDIHIIRCKDYKNYLGNDFVQITIEEWHNFISSDSQMELKNKLSLKNPQTGKEISMYGDFGIYKIGDSEIAFNYSRGKIWTGYSEESVNKAIEIADRLGAKVYGDEGEEYSKTDTSSSQDLFDYSETGIENKVKKKSPFSFMKFFKK